MTDAAAIGRNGEVGIVGLGRMGNALGLQLCERGFRVVGFDVVVGGREGSIEYSNSLEDLCSRLAFPRVVLVMVPAGSAVDEVIEKLEHLLEEGDAILECGNSWYLDSIRRGRELGRRGVRFLDVGVSGGLSGARHGASLTIGGDERDFSHFEHLFRAMSASDGYAHVGPTGWGHLVKTVHNGIEYGFLQALGEGLNLIRTAAAAREISVDLAAICSAWSHGSIIESRLVRDAVTALDLIERSPDMLGVVGGGETGTWARQVAREHEVPVPALEAALAYREKTRTEPDFAGKVIAAVRKVFGGHGIVTGDR